MSANSILTFTNIQHQFRNDNGLSCVEYVLLDMVYFLSTNPDSKVKGWCYCSRERMAAEIGLTKQAILSMITRLCEAGFMEKDEATKFLRTRPKYHQVYFPKQTDGKETLPPGEKQTNGKETLPMDENTDGKETLPQVNKLDFPGKESLPENNTIITNTNTGGITRMREGKNSEQPKQPQQPNTPSPGSAPPLPTLRDSMMKIYSYPYSQLQSEPVLKHLMCEQQSFVEWKTLVDLVDQEFPEVWEYARFLTPPEFEKLKKDPVIRFTPDTYEIVLTEICSKIDPSINMYRRIKMYMTSPMTLKKLKRDTNGKSNTTWTNNQNGSYNVKGGSSKIKIGSNRPGCYDFGEKL